MENITSSDNEKTTKNKLSIAALVFTLILVLAGIAGFILTAAAKFLVAAVVCVPVGLIGYALDKNSDSKKRIIGRIIALIIILFFMFSMSPLIIRSSNIWQYPFQKFYIGLYQKSDSAAWFPDFRNDVQSGYSFEYMPSIMQGTGHYSVCFVTSTEIAAEYERKFASQAKYIVPLDDFTARSFYSVNGNSDNPWEDDVLDIYWNMNFWQKGEEPNAKIYVLDAVLNYNHPHSSAVIIDTESGRVQLSRLG